MRVKPSALGRLASRCSGCLMFFLASSCGVDRFHTIGRPYSATQTELAATAYGSYCVAANPLRPINLLVVPAVPFALADAGLSFGVETIVLPWDLASGPDEPKHPLSEVEKSCELWHQASPTPAAPAPG
jgi:hypothetical protein